MAAATYDRQTAHARITGMGKLTLATGATIYNGTMACANSAGLGVNASDAAALIVMGRADEKVSEAGGDDYVEYSTGWFWFANSATNAVDVADIGRPCWVEDDQTVADRPGTNGVVAGIVKDVDATLGVLVAIESNSAQSVAVQALAAPGAALPGVMLTTLAVDGTDPYTLADGTFAGQLHYFRCISAANTPVGTLTPATPTGFATITFDAVGECALLMWTGAAWIILMTSGATVA